MGEAFANEGSQVVRSFQGAAAVCGGGESEQVGDRPRTDNGDPEGPYVLISGCISIELFVDEFSLHHGPLHRCLTHRVT